MVDTYNNPISIPRKISVTTDVINAEPGSTIDTYCPEPANDGIATFVWNHSILGLIAGKKVRGFRRGGLLAALFACIQVAILLCPLLIEQGFEYYLAGILTALVTIPLDVVLFGLVLMTRRAVKCVRIMAYVILFGLQVVSVVMIWYIA